MVNALLVEGIHLESIGGEVPSVEVSGLTGQGLDHLVETISAVAEMQDLRAEHDLNAHGYVLESKVQKGLGYVLLLLSPILRELTINHRMQTGRHCSHNPWNSQDCYSHHQWHHFRPRPCDE